MPARTFEQGIHCGSNIRMHTPAVAVDNLHCHVKGGRRHALDHCLLASPPLRLVIAQRDPVRSRTVSAPCFPGHWDHTCNQNCTPCKIHAPYCCSARSSACRRPHPCSLHAFCHRSCRTKFLQQLPDNNISKSRGNVGAESRTAHVWMPPMRSERVGFLIRRASSPP